MFSLLAKSHSTTLLFSHKFTLLFDTLRKVVRH